MLQVKLVKKKVAMKRKKGKSGTFSSDSAAANVFTGMKNQAKYPEYLGQGRSRDPLSFSRRKRGRKRVDAGIRNGLPDFFELAAVFVPFLPGGFEVKNEIFGIEPEL